MYDCVLDDIPILLSVSCPVDVIVTSGFVSVFFTVMVNDSSVSVPVLMITTASLSVKLFPISTLAAFSVSVSIVIVYVPISADVVSLL